MKNFDAEILEDWIAARKLRLLQLETNEAVESFYDNLLDVQL